MLARTSNPPDESEGYEGERLYCITPSGFGDWVNIRSIIVSAFQAFVFFDIAYVALSLKSFRSFKSLKSLRSSRRESFSLLYHPFGVW